MFFALSKILLFLTYPIIWILLCILFYFIFRKKRHAKYWLISAAAIFFIFSNAFIYTQFLMRWEGSNENFALPIISSGDKPYDAVVVLGGFSNWNEKHHMVTFNHSADRIIETLKIYHEGISRTILLSGGSGLLLKPEEKESIWMKDYLTKLGVKANDIFIEGESKNTHENAVYSAEFIKTEFGEKGKYLLITSAFHMNRAEACFKKTNLNFDYYRVDFLVDDDDYNLGYLIPSALVLESWQMLFKEWIGYSVYWVRGYL